MLANKFRRLALLVEPDIQRMLDKQGQRTLGHDDVRFDERNSVVGFYRNDRLIWQPRAEKIGVFHGDIGIFRWWWSGSSMADHRASARLDLAYREGQRYQLAELTTDPVQLTGEDEARELAQLAAQLARADGCMRFGSGEHAVYVALFEPKPGDSALPNDARDTSVTGLSRPSWLTNDPLDQPTDRPPQFVPAAIGSARPPADRRGWSIAPSARTSDPGPMRASLGIRSIPPQRALEVSPDLVPQIPPPPRVPTPPEAVAQLPIREPNRDLFMPLAAAALADIVHVSPGFGQALVVVRVEVESATAKGRFFVQLVCSDDLGELVALDPSRALLDAAARFIADDIRDGNGRWKKLVARMRPSPRGASVDCEVI